MFLDALIREYLSRHYPGRQFSSVHSVPHCGDYLIHEVNGLGRDLQILRTARIDPRSVRLKPGAECARYIIRQLDKAFDTRSEFEKLPWQLFALPP